MRREKQDYRNWVALSIMSISACAICYVFRFSITIIWVKVEEWSALMGTAGAVAFVAAVLLIVTIILNAITLIVYRDRTAKVDG